MRLFPRYDGPPLLEQVCRVENLTNAWRRVRRNIQVGRRHRSAGVDAVTLRDFERDWTNQMAALAEDLQRERYQPLPPRMVRIPKASGGERAIAILAVRDRIAQRAVQQVLEPLFDPLLLDCSYGCRLHVGVPHALAQVSRSAERGLGWVLDGDIAHYFDSIDHAILLRLVEQRITEAPILRLVEQWLEVGMLDDRDGAGVQEANATWWAQLMGEGDAADADVPSSAGTDPQALVDLDAAARWEYGSPWDAHAAEWRMAVTPPASPTPWTMLQYSDRFWTALSLATPVLRQARNALPVAQRTVQRIGGHRLALVGAGLAVATGTVAVGEALWRRQREGRRGTPQGGALSPLLANIYLHPFDLALTRQGFRLVRFMDDFVVLCATEEDAHRALALVQRQMKALRLDLNPQKTQVVRYADGFEFLGQVLVPRQRGLRPSDGVSSFAEAAQRFGFGTPQSKQRRRG